MIPPPADPDFQSRRWLLAAEKFVSQGHEDRLKSIEFLHAYALNTLRNLFLLNAGSILAVLTFLGYFFGKGDQTSTLIGIHLGKSVIWAFYCFCGGIACVIIASGLGYINWSAAAEGEIDSTDAYNFIHGRPRLERKAWVAQLVRPTNWAALGFATASLVAWLIGAWTVARGFAAVGIS